MCPSSCVHSKLIRLMASNWPENSCRVAKYKLGSCTIIKIALPVCKGTEQHHCATGVADKPLHETLFAAAELQATGELDILFFFSL